MSIKSKCVIRAKTSLEFLEKNSGIILAKKLKAPKSLVKQSCQCQNF